MKTLYTEVAKLPPEVRRMVWGFLAEAQETEAQETAARETGRYPFDVATTLGEHMIFRIPAMDTLAERHPLIATDFGDEYLSELLSTQEILFPCLLVDFGYHPQDLPLRLAGIQRFMKFLARRGQLNSLKKIGILFIPSIHAQDLKLNNNYQPFHDNVETVLLSFLKIVPTLPHRRLTLRIRYSIDADGYSRFGRLSKLGAPMYGEESTMDCIIGDSDRTRKFSSKMMEGFDKKFRDRADAEKASDSIHGPNMMQSYIDKHNAQWNDRMDELKKFNEKLIDLMDRVVQSE